MRPVRSWTAHLLALALLTACAGRPSAALEPRLAATPGRTSTPTVQPAAPGRTPTPPSAAEPTRTPAPDAAQSALRPFPRLAILTPREPTRPASPTSDPRLPALAAGIATLLQATGGAYGVTIEWVPTGQRASHNPDRVFESASVYKLAVAYDVLRQVDLGQLALDAPLTVTDDDAVEPEPDGGLAPNDEVSVWEALQAMMGPSSNSAAHALMRLIGRADVNAALRALGLRATRVPLEADDPDQSSAVTTAGDMAQLLHLLATDRILSPEMRQDLRTLLALPKDLDPLTACLPTGTPIWSKNGNQERASNVAGLISTPRGAMIVSIFDEDVDPGDARATIASITQAAWKALAE